MASKFGFLKEALSSPGKLTEEEELDLVKKYQSGDMSAYRKLRLSLRPLVEKSISDAIPAGNDVSASNLRMRADVEMPKILQNFDVNRGIKLKTFVLTQLKGYLKNAVAENVSGPYVPRNLHTDLNRFRQAMRDAEMEYGKNPTEAQIHSFYPTEAATPFEKIKDHHVNSYIGDAVFGEDEDGEGLTFKDQFTDGHVISNDDLMSGVYEDEQNEMIGERFTPAEQKIIELVHKQGQPFVQVALSLGTSTGEVRKTMRKWYEATQNN